MIQFGLNFSKILQQYFKPFLLFCMDLDRDFKVLSNKLYYDWIKRIKNLQIGFYTSFSETDNVEVHIIKF